MCNSYARWLNYNANDIDKEEAQKLKNFISIKNSVHCTYKWNRNEMVVA